MARLRDTNPDPVALPGGKRGQVSHDAAGRAATWSPTSTAGLGNLRRQRQQPTRRQPSFSYAVVSSSTIRVIALFQGCLAACTMRPYPTRVDVNVLRPLSWPTTLRPTAVRNATPCHNSSGFLASPYAS
jgi:hypothetical protein